jgi:threonine dehydratase
MEGLRMTAACDIEAIRAARQRIASHIHETPLLSSRSLDRLVGGSLVFKCENFQRAGSFKSRGAFNAVFSLTDGQAARGVVTSSSGNQAAALSLAAQTRGIPAHVVMPRVALKTKVAAVERYGGTIAWIGGEGEVPTSEDYDAAVADIAARTGAEPIHPFDDPRTIAGQGTCALEFLRQAPDLDSLLCPVGGGGLLAGTAIAAKALRPEVRVIGCEPANADDAWQSFRRKCLVPQRDPRTIADGLRTSLGTLTLPAILEHVDDIVTVSEEAIVAAMRLMWEMLKIVVEPSSAVPLAAILERRWDAAGQRVGIIVSGGNADLGSLPWRSAG